MKKLILKSRFHLVKSLLAGLMMVQPVAAQPLLYHLESGPGELYILGGTEVPEPGNWLSPQIQAAFESSSTFWLEVPPEDDKAGIPAIRTETVPGAGAALHPAVIAEGYGNLAFGDYLDVSMGERSVVESQRLNLGNINFRAMKPWLAYYSFYYAFWDRQNLALVDPGDILLKQARDAGKQLSSLFADRQAYYQFMGRMNDFAQTHYFQTLYNMMDAQRSGEFASRYHWTDGNPDAKWLEQTRTVTPYFYRYMYERHNPEIVDQLMAILAAGGTHFLYVDINRMLGPDSLITILQSRGMQVEPSPP